MATRETFVPTKADLIVVKSELKLMEMTYPKFCGPRGIKNGTFTSMIGGHISMSDHFRGIIFDFLTERGKLSE